MTFRFGPGSADPCLCLMDPDLVIFVIDPQDANKKLIFVKELLLITFWRYIYIIFQRSQKELQNSRNQGVSYYFCVMMEASGSGSRRHKNMWIRIRIRNTESETYLHVTWRLVSGPPCRRVEDTSGQCSGWPAPLCSCSNWSSYWSPNW